MKNRGVFIPPLIILAVSLMILWLSPSGSRSMEAFFISPLRNGLLFGNVLNRASLLLLPGLAIILAFGTGVFNLGGEGQIYLGGLSALVILTLFPNMPVVPAWLLAWSLAALIGGALALLSAFLKELGNVNELISTYLLSLGISHLVDGLITGPLADKDSYLMTTRPIAEAYRLNSWHPPSHLNGSLILTLLILLIIYLFLYRRQEGFYWRLSGMNPSLAEYAGAQVTLIRRRALFLSGALHGLTGALLICGSYFMALQGFSGGYGWDGMAVALMAELHPLGLIPAALFFSFLLTGAENAHLQGYLGVNLEGFLLALAFFLVSSRVILQKRRHRAL